MTHHEHDEPLTEQELEQAEGEELPAREEMSPVALDTFSGGVYTLPVEPPTETTEE